MEHIAAIMMLVGCTQGTVDCRELPAPAVGFETAEECQELLRPAIDEVRSGYRVVYGKCADIDPALYIEDATITWDITPSDELDVQITFDDPADDPTLPMMVAEKTSRKAVLSN